MSMVFCRGCGKEIHETAVTCPSCGAPQNIPNSGKLSSSPIIKDGTIALWNPLAAALWSIILTPIFGTYIHLLNWKALNEPQKESSAKIWFYVSFFVIIISLFFMGGNAGLGSLIYLIVWYLVAGLLQKNYLSEKFGSNYIRKSWAKPLLIAFIIPIIFGIVPAIAIPVYQDYKVRGEILNALISATEAKFAFASYYEEHQQVPGNLADAGFEKESLPSSVKDISLYNNKQHVAIIITMAIEPIKDKRLLLVPVLDENKNINFECKSPEIPEKYLPKECRQTQK
jgi:hypothetical protein